jgi:hypothetical protein
MRRITESQFHSATNGSLADTSPAGFVACPIPAPSAAVMQMWQAMYQYAFAQALAHALEDAQPTRYQRLVWQAGMN